MAEGIQVRLTFKRWFRQVDLEVLRLTEEVGVHDLADCTFYSWYEDEATPEEAAYWALEENGFPMEALVA